MEADLDEHFRYVYSGGHKDNDNYYLVATTLLLQRNYMRFNLDSCSTSTTTPIIMCVIVWRVISPPSSVGFCPQELM